MNEIAYLRAKCGLTQSELGEKVGVDNTTVSKWETGNVFPRADKIPLIAAALGCEIADLFGQTKKEVTM